MLCEARLEIWGGGVGDPLVMSDMTANIAFRRAVYVIVKNYQTKGPTNRSRGAPEAWVP